MILPVILGWTEPMYLYVPGSWKVKENGSAVSGARDLKLPIDAYHRVWYVVLVGPCNSRSRGYLNR
jgi:hypothetical protein